MTFKKQVRGVRVSMPTGYVVGRTSGGTGPAELIHLSGLATALVNTGIVAGGSASLTAELTLSLFAPGPFSNSQQFTIPPAPHPLASVASFPDAADPDVIKSQFPPAGNITFYLVDNLVNFLALGAPNGVFATITFLAGHVTGTIVYSGDTISPAEVLYLVMPASADVSFSGLTLVIHGVIQ